MTPNNRLVKKLRETLGMTEREFALLIGASTSAIKSWERKTDSRELSKEYNYRILVATGAVIENGKIFPVREQALNPKAKMRNYRKKDFDYWRNTMGATSVEMARSYTATAAEQLSMLFLAGACIEMVKGEKVDFRLPGLFASFNTWVRDAAREFDLSDQLEKLRKANKDRVAHWTNDELTVPLPSNLDSKGTVLFPVFEKMAQ